MNGAYFNDCAEVLLTVRLNRKKSGGIMSRGLLVAMEAVSKTVTLVVREKYDAFDIASPRKSLSSDPFEI